MKHLDLTKLDMTRRAIAIVNREAVEKLMGIGYTIATVDHVEKYGLPEFVGGLVMFRIRHHEVDIFLLSVDKLPDKIVSRKLLERLKQEG